MCAPLVLGLASIASAQVAGIPFIHQIFEFAAYYTAFYGDGRDGALTVPTGGWTGGYIGFPTRPLSVNTIRSYLTADASVGSTTLTINSGYSSSAFDSGSASGFSSCSGACSATTDFQELLIIQMGGPNAGTYEFAQLQTRSGATLTLKSALTNAYSASNLTQVLVVPRYTNVTLNSGGFISVGKWDGYTGGVIAFRANGTVSMNNSDSSGTGRWVSRVVAGYWQDMPSNAGFGFAGGTNGAPNAYSAFSPTAAVSSYDGQSLTPASTIRLMMGSGGRGTGGTGGAGGGVILVKANAINIGGQFTAVGQPGSSAQGGAGGTVSISANSIGEYVGGSCVTSGTGNVRATGGSGSTSGQDGRIFVNYGSSITANCRNVGAPANVTTVRGFVSK